MTAQATAEKRKYQISSAMEESAREACDLLRALANETRLMILCMLADGEKSVGDMEEFLDMRQPTVSQQLARLRYDGLVETRRDGKTIYYSLSSTNAKSLIDLLYRTYCEPKMGCPR
jgi:DNA-binding transcriptional ArsR family regulator